MKDKTFVIYDQLTGKREYICHAEKDCALCKHCYDVLWDYTNGPYMFICDVGETSEDKHYCDKFEEKENPVYGDPDMYLSDEDIKKFNVDDSFNNFVEKLADRLLNNIK